MEILQRNTKLYQQYTRSRDHHSAVQISSFNYQLCVCKPVNSREVTVSVFQSVDKEQPVHSIGIQLESPLFHSSASK